MIKNIGVIDKIIRFVVIDLLLGFSFLGKDIPPYLATISFVVCVLLVISMFTSYSPIYHVFGWNTREKKPSNPDLESSNSDI